MWRLDIDQKIGETLTLQVDLFGKDVTLEGAMSIYRPILAANPEVFESDIKSPNALEPTFEMTFKKHGVFSEQDPDDCSIIHWPPYDPIEWTEGA